MSGAAPAVAADIHRVAVIGGGLVGGSVALAARAAGVERVVLADRDPAVRDRGSELGLADTVTATVTDACRDADLVVIATPARAAASLLQEAANCTDSQTILTDVSSLKSHLVPEVESFLVANGRFPERFVGGHPMAGSERSGPDAADATLFQGATWVLTPTARTDPGALRRLGVLLRGFGARVLTVTPTVHDQLVAVVSHLPQLAASALADVADDATRRAGDVVLALAGGGFRDTTRIAASDPELWLGILQGNRDAVLEVLGAYQDRLDAVARALEGHDWAAVTDLLTRASEARRRFVPKRAATDLVDLVIALADQPGTLARATTALGEAGVNVEDLAMRHAEDGTRGVLVVRIDATARAAALAALAAAGLPAHVESNGGHDAPGAAP